MDNLVIRTPQDLQKLPNFVDFVDPDAHPLVRIVKHYNFRVEFPCGLKSCRQPHKEGCLVELDGGHYANIGWRCGEVFGEKFGIERTRYTERELRPKAIATIQHVVATIRGMRDEMYRLCDEADRLSRCKYSLRERFPKLASELERRAHQGNDHVVEQVERKQEDVDNLHEMNPHISRERLRYEEVPRGVLPGLRVLATNIREAVITQFTNKADELLALNANELSTEKLLEWEGWANNFDEACVKAASVVRDGNEFFSSKTFKLMAYLTVDRSVKKALAELTPGKLLKVDNVKQANASFDNAAASQTKKQREAKRRVDAIQEKARRKGWM